MTDFYSDRAAAQLEHTTIAFLESKGETVNQHGNLIAEKIVDPATDGRMFDLSRYIGQPQKADADVALSDDTPLNEAAALFSTGALAGDHDPDLYADGCTETSDSVTNSDDEEATETPALLQLTKRNKSRETLRVRDLSSNREFTDAVLTGDFHKANDMMIAVLRDTKAPYALRIACIGGMKQIAPLVGTDDGSELNDAWLNRGRDGDTRSAHGLARGNQLCPQR